MEYQKTHFKHTVIFAALLTVIPMLASAQTLDVKVVKKTDIPAQSVTVKTSGDNSAESIYGNSSNGKTIPDFTMSWDASSNQVNVSGESISNDKIGDIYGGKIGSDDVVGIANNNTVTVETVTATDVYGGYAGKLGNQANTNIVKIVRSDITNAYGGYTLKGEASQNLIEISQSIIEGGTIYGGYSDDMGNVNNNIVKLTQIEGQGSSNSSADIYGGYTDKGNADNNQVILTKAKNIGSIYGGYSDDMGTTTNNNILMSEVEIDDRYADIIGGYSHNGGDVSQNVIIIDRSHITADSSWSPGDDGILGGYSADGNGNAEKNIVTITNSTIDADIGGGSAYQGDAINNAVTIKDSSYQGGNIYGGYSQYDSVVKNTVVLDHVTGEDASIYGGYSDAEGKTGGALNNSVIIKNHSVFDLGSSSSSVYGAYSDRGSEPMKGNSVIVDNSHLANSVQVYGAYSDGENQVLSENSIILQNGANASGRDVMITAAYSENSTAIHNQVIIDRSTVNGDGDSNKGIVFGAFIDGGSDDSSKPSSATGNQVVVRNKAEVTGAVYGSYTEEDSGYVVTNNDNSIFVSDDAFINGDVYGAYAITDGETHVSGNRAFLDSARVVGNITGAYSNNSDVGGNTAFISGHSEVSGNVVGGYTEYGNADNNIVFIADNSIISGKAYGAYTESGSANENMLKIANGTLKDNVFAAYSESGDIARNTVDISGGNIQKDIYGGYTESGKATDNILMLSGTPELGKTSTIYGGYSDSNDDAVTGNRLYFNNYNGSAIYDIKNVENTVIDSRSNVTLAKNNEAIQLYRLTNNGNLSLSTGDDRTDGHLVIGFINNDGTVSGGYAGDGKITLDIDAATGKADTVIFNQKTVEPTAAFEGHLTNGVSGKIGAKAIQSYYDAGNPVYIAETQTEKANFTMKAIGNRVFRINRDASMSMSQYATPDGNTKSYGWYLGESKIVPIENSYSKAQIAGLAALRLNSDLFGKIAQTDLGKYGFAHIDYQNVGYDVSGNLDLSGKSIVVGTSFGEDDKKNDTMGIFFEAGHYSYSASDNIANAMSDTASPTGFRSSRVHAHGSTDYYGIGLFGRHNFDEYSRIEMLGRIGRIESDYKTHSIDKSNFDIKNTYYGLGIGGVYSYPLDDSKAIEAFGKLYWTHIGSDSYKTKAGNKIKFDSSDSLLGKIGARLVSLDKERIRPYAGIALEHEFSGDSHVKVDGEHGETTSIKDTAGSLELGLRGNSKNQRWNYDFSIKGYTGAYDGYGLNFKVNYRFE